VLVGISYLYNRRRTHHSVERPQPPTSLSKHQTSQNVSGPNDTSPALSNIRFSIRSKAVNEEKSRETTSDKTNAYVFYFSNDCFASLSQSYDDPFRTFLDVAFVAP